VPQPIEEPGDPRLSDYRRLGDAAWLRARGLFVAEGRLVVERLIAANRFGICSILVTPAAAAALEHPLSTAACPVYEVSRELLETLTNVDFHRGCLALAQRPPAGEPDDLVAGSRYILAIEGVANPDNVGGLFRVAEAFGTGGVLLDPTSGDPLYRKSIRTSMGAVLRLPFVRLTSWPDGLDRIRQQGFKVVALTPRAAAMSLADCVLSLHAGERLVTVAGGEGSGLSETILAMADVRVRIPLSEGVDSLNVVVAAGIALAALQPLR
jgi:tRNA G18 (ribose-2'-O)-methylase SpoU